MIKNQHNKGKVLGKLVPLLIIFAALLVIAVIALLPEDKAEPKSTPPPPVNVVVERIELIASMPDEFQLDGKVEPNLIVQVSAEVDGRIERYGPYTGPDKQRQGQQLDEGDFIQAGEPLIYLNTELLQAAYDQSKAQYEQDLRNHELFKSARSRNIATQKELDEARTSLELSKATLQEVKAKLDRTVIRAPVSGIINRLSSEVGEYVQAGMACVQIVDTETVKIIVNVPEQDISYFAVGQPQKIFVQCQGQVKTITGPISYISEVAEPVAHTTRIEISVPNTDHELHSGQFVTVKLKRRDLKNVIMVPLDAIIPLEDGYLCYVVEGGKAQPRETIQIDLRSIKGKHIRVLAGLEAGDQLILFPGNHLCGPGQKIKIISKEPAQLRSKTISQQQQQEN